MYKKEWTVNTIYNRGDIIHIPDSTTSDLSFYSYFICLSNHTSCNLTYPCNEDIYWLKITDINIKPIFSECDKQQFDNYMYNLPIIFIPNYTEAQCTEAKLTENETQLNNVVKTPKNKFKRKLDDIDNEIIEFKKKRKTNDDLSLKDQIKLLDVSIETKIFLLNKYETMQKSCNSDYSKSKTWLNTVINLPFGKYTKLNVNKNSNKKINKFFKNIRDTLDSKIYGLDYVKDEIIEFIAKKITNQNSKGHILALQGPAGVAKSEICSVLGKALNIPFFKINCGGLNDVSVITGHSETYVGSKPGKIVEILTSANCMDPIIFLDEIDKLSSSRDQELNGILTHMLDEKQNIKFQDNYLSNIDINLNKVFFVIAFNDKNKIDPIVLDRLKIIKIESPSIDDKVNIASKRLIPDILNDFNFEKNKYINIDTELLKFIINKNKDDGVRQLKQDLEKLFSKLNLLILTNDYKTNKKFFNITFENDEVQLENKIECINIKKEFIDFCLKNEIVNESFMHMYI